MKLTITEIAIHPETSNPIFGELVTKVRLDDDYLPGTFFKIIQDDGKFVHEIRMDFIELEYLVTAIKMLQSGIEGENDDQPR
jgi:hypothetical protein